MVGPGTVRHDMEDYQDRLRIATPEGVTVDLVLAGLGSRFSAGIVDLTLKGLLIAAAWLGAALVLRNDLGIAFASIATFVIYFGYDVAFEVLGGGRTPGKRMTGLRVLRDDGRPVDLLSSCIRNVIRLVDGLTLLYLPAMVSILVTRNNQRLGDLAARTIVVRDPAKAGNDAELRRAAARTAPPGPLPRQFGDGGWAMPAGAARPRANGALDVSAVLPEDLRAIRAFLDRRADLPAGARGDIARRIVSALQPRLGGATGHLPDEDLLEAVAAAKARER
jgi:uncharacterized RDD family membrane protein YckC